MTLKSRLILITIAILTIIGLGIGASATLSVRASILRQLDSQLETMSELALNGPGGWGSPGAPASVPNERSQSGWQQDVRKFLSIPGRSDGALAAIVADGEVTAQVTRARRGGPVDVSQTELGSLLHVDSRSGALTTELGALGRYRVLAVELRQFEGTLVVGLPQDSADTAIQQTLVSTSIAVAIGVVATGLVAAWVITRQLRPLERVATTATEVSELNLETGRSALTKRVPEELIRPGTEVGDVGRAMNHMLEHVDDALSARYQSELQVRRFVADASHELRTPLATIRGYTDLTRPAWPQLPDVVRQSLERIDTGAKRMSSLIEDLLLLARLDAQEENVVGGEVDLSAVIIEVIDNAHITSPKHYFDLNLPAVPLKVVGNENRIVQVLTNVIANAGSHTPVGTRVTVTAKALPATADVEGERPTVRVTIADDGPGIDSEVRDRVFDRFVRASDGRERGRHEQNVGGSSGLGLAITHSLMNAIGGTVTVESCTAEESGGAHGTVFTLDFPQVTAET